MRAFYRYNRGRIHIHVATLDVESTLRVGGWVGFMSIVSTFNRGKMTIL